jgi:hypothetical protein
MSTTALAQLVSFLALGVLVLVLARVGRQDNVVVGADAQYTLPGGTTTRKVRVGSVVPEGAVLAENPETKQVRRSWLGAMIVGRDHRSSTSKTVVFMWTLAIAWGLLSLFLAYLFGDPAPWEAQVKSGLQEEYLLLLGGPFAAAVLAKYLATGRSETKLDAPVGEATPAQLVINDDGDADLGDFQYALFNVIALAFFLGAFLKNPSGGFPLLPPLLTGLVLTSAGGYAGKKFLAQATPTLTSVVPAAARPGVSVQVFGTNLAISASASATDEQIHATVLVGQVSATVAAHDVVLGNDRLTVTIPPDATPGSAPITATRADGVSARGPSGANSLPFEVLAKAPPTAPPTTTGAV